MAQVRDPAFMESININMRVPERLSVAPGPGSPLWPTAGGKRVPPAYAMHIPERLTYSEVPDLSPRSQLKPPPSLPVGLEPCGEALREGLQSPIRRSYSDQSFGWTPPSTPTHLKQALMVPRHPSSSTMVTWSPEEDGGSAVELIILRRQVMKMSRRLAALERNSANQRNTEVLLFSLLVSACLLNAWLWIRR